MEFEDKQTSSFREPAPEAGGDNAHFLQSLGFDEEELRSLEAHSDDEHEEEVALSSQPDDLEIPGTDSKKPASPRVVGVQIGNAAHRVESDGRIEISPNRATPGEEEVDSNPEMDSTEKNADEPAEGASSEPDKNLLYLHCPSCDGELVLQKEHVGVEGACVWCDIKIVAARAGIEGDVKVFSLEPVKAEEPKKVGIEEPVEKAAADTAVEPEPVSEEPVPEDVLPEMEDSIESEEASPEMADEIASEEPAMEESPDGFSSPWGSALEVDGSEEAKPDVSGDGVDAEPAFEGWSGMASMESASQVEDGGDGSVAMPDEAIESAPVNESAATESAAAPDSGFSAWGDTPAAFEPVEQGNEQVSQSPSAESDAAEMKPSVGFEDMDFGAAEEEKSPALEGDNISDDLAFSPFSGDSAPSPMGESNPASSNEFDTAPQPVDFEPPVEEPLEALFGSEPEVNELEDQGQNPEASSFAFEGFGNAAPDAEAPAESGWEGTIGSSENPDIELAPLPIPDEPFSSPAQETASSEASGVPAADHADSGFGLPESKGMAEEAFSSAPSESPFSPATGAGEESTSGFSMQESAGFADPFPAPVPTGSAATSPVSDLEDEFGSSVLEEGDGSSPDGFQIPPQESEGFGMNASTDQGPAPADNPVESTPTPSPSYADPFASTPESKAFGGSSDQESPFFNDDSETFSPAQDRASAAPEESPFSEGLPAPVSETGQDASAFSGAPENPFDEAVEQAPAAPPSFPGPDEAPVTEAPVTEAPVTEAPVTETPHEATSPIEVKKSKSKKAKGPRKGLVILLVVLIGFVCGAALASFVLPVDQYIVKARAFMEERFNPGGAVLNQDILPQPIGTSDPHS